MKKHSKKHGIILFCLVMLIEVIYMQGMIQNKNNKIKIADEMIPGAPASVNSFTPMDYYVSNSGNDNNSGTSETQAWRTITKVNNFNLMPGDVVHFKCGDGWREQLVPANGDSNRYITYTSYGSGSKPSIYGSIPKNLATDWKQESAKIWTLNTNSISAVQLINQKNIQLWQENGAKVIFDNDINRNGFVKIESILSGSAINHVQFILKGLNIEAGKNYILSFKAKCSTTMKIPIINLMKNSSPWSAYYSRHSDLSANISTDWNEYSIVYTVNNTDSNGRITYYLGNVFQPNTTLYLKDIGFSETNSDSISDVGNIIFNDGQTCGIKVFSEGELNVQNKFLYDNVNKTIKIFSEKNPAELYSNIECALSSYIIDESNKSYVVYNNLDLRYGGAHGIGGGNTHHIKVINCDLSYIGGGEQPGLNKVRYGNGIEFWGNAHDNLVEGCNIQEIYDAALTNQGNADGTQQFNITYRNNLIRNAEMSFEYWNRGIGSQTYGIRFENNLCIDAGAGWSHAQRPDPIGTHVMFYTNTSSTKDFVLSENTFGTAKGSVVTVTAVWDGLENIQFQDNKYMQVDGNAILRLAGKTYLENDLDKSVSINNYLMSVRKMIGVRQ